MKRALALLLVACAETGGPSVAPASAPLPSPPAAPSWAEAFVAPQGLEGPVDARVGALLEACGRGDAALMRVARDAANDPEPRLRELGSPLLHPRVVTASETGDALRARLRAMRTPHTRCGVALEGNGATIVTAEALASLQPLPVRTRTGAWLSLDATLEVPASGAKVVVLGPRGAPKSYPTTMDARGRTLARFALDQPGAFTVQLLATTDDGPRPVLEARVFADVAPSHASAAAPGEDAPSLEAMIATVRTEEGLPMLRRDPRLDTLAATHAERMQRAGRVAHDLGDGDLAHRFEAEGFAASVVGENVARAETLALAHRTLYASPSHRANLLNAQYTRMGLATVTDGPRIWVCEVFSSDLR